MTSLIRLYEEQGQSPWLDNLTRPSLDDGTIEGLIARGVRGITANPTIIAKAIESSDAYDQHLFELRKAGNTVEDAYWDLAVADVIDALELLRPTFEASESADGFVSIEVAPGLAHDTRATMKAARDLHDRIGEPNLLVKIPAASAGVPAIGAMVAEGRASTSPWSSPWPATARSSRPTWWAWRPWPTAVRICPLCTAWRRSS